MPDLRHTGGEPLHLPGLPEWRPGDVWHVAEEFAERLLASHPALAVVPPEGPAPEDVSAAAPATGDAPVGARKASK